MKFYNKYYANNYEELISYYPRYYRDVFEMVAILQAQGRLADDLEGHIEQAYLNNFILTADEATIKTWEGVLHITYKQPLTLDQRRRVVIGRVSGYGHIGEQEIRALIAEYTDKGVAVDFMRGVISIVIEGEVFDEANLLDTILRRIPGHLALKMAVHVRRAFRHTVDIGFGGATGAAYASAPVGEDRKATLPLSMAQGGFLTSGAAAGVRRAATGRTSGAGGVFYHTHITSKLIG